MTLEAILLAIAASFLPLLVPACRRWWLEQRWPMRLLSLLAVFAIVFFSWGYGRTVVASWVRYRAVVPTGQLRLALAQFQGPSGVDNRFSDQLLSIIVDSLRTFQHMSVLPIRRPLGSHDEARLEGIRTGADLVIWGWYDLGDSVVVEPQMTQVRVRPQLDLSVPKQRLAWGRSEFDKMDVHRRVAHGISGVACFVSGMALYNAGQMREAAPRLGYALRSGAFDRYPESRAQLALHLSTALGAIGQHQAALAAADTAVSADSTLGTAWLALGLESDELGLTAQALDAYTRATRLITGGRTRSRAFVNRSQLYTRLGEDQLALRDLDSASALVPESAVVHFLRAKRQFDGMHRDDGMASLERAVRAAPRWSLPYVVRGTEKARIGDGLGAIQDFSTAIDFWRPGATKVDGDLVELSDSLTVGEVYWLRAQCYAAIGQNREALRDAEIVVSVLRTPYTVAFRDSLARKLKSKQ